MRCHGAADGAGVAGVLGAPAAPGNHACANSVCICWGGALLPIPKTVAACRAWNLVIARRASDSALCSLGVPCMQVAVQVAPHFNISTIL